MLTLLTWAAIIDNVAMVTNDLPVIVEVGIDETWKGGSDVIKITDVVVVVVVEASRIQSISLVKIT